MNTSAQEPTIKADVISQEPTTVVELTAGQILQAAREAQNIDRGLLAAALKVQVAQLEALENDQYDQLPDSAFTRNFAKTVCQRLKIDEKPVLERLPGLNSQSVIHAAMKVSQVSKESALRGQAFKGRPLTSRKKSSRIWWIMLALLLIVLGLLFLLPNKWFGTGLSVTEGDSTAISPLSQTERGVISVHISPPPPTTMLPTGNSLQEEPRVGEFVFFEESLDNDEAAQSVELTERADNESTDNDTVNVTDISVVPQMFVMTTRTESWTSIQSASGRVLFQKTLKSGEELSLPLEDLPWKVRIGNASYAIVTVRGEALPLRTSSGNVADFEVN